MTEAIAPANTPAPRASGGLTALAVLFSMINGLAVLLVSISLAAFLMGYDGEDVLAPRVVTGLMLAIIALIAVTTIIGWRGLGRRPWRALLVMGAPGALMASLMILSLVSASRDISRMQAEMERTGRVPVVRP